MQPAVSVSVASEHCPSIGARKGDFVLELPSGHVCVFHPADVKQITPEDRLRLIPYPTRLES